MHYIALVISMTIAIAAQSIHGMIGLQNLLRQKPTKEDLCTLIKLGNADQFKNTLESIVCKPFSNKYCLDQDDNVWIDELLKLAEKRHAKWNKVLSTRKSADKIKIKNALVKLGTGTLVLGVIPVLLRAADAARHAYYTHYCCENFLYDLCENNTMKYWAMLGALGYTGVKQVGGGTLDIKNELLWKQCAETNLQSAQNICAYLTHLKQQIQQNVNVNVLYEQFGNTLALYPSAPINTFSDPEHIQTN